MTHCDQPCRPPFISKVTLLKRDAITKLSQPSWKKRFPRLASVFPNWWAYLLSARALVPPPRPRAKCVVFSSVPAPIAAPACWVLLWHLLPPKSLRKPAEWTVFERIAECRERAILSGGSGKWLVFEMVEGDALQAPFYWALELTLGGK